METKMEMHTPQSLRAIHGLDVRPRRRSSALRRWLSHMARRIRETNRRRRNDKMLMTMSDRDLGDIGLSRADLSAIRHGRRRPRRR